MKNPEFLKKKYDLHKAPEVVNDSKRTLKRSGEKVPQAPSEQIENYLNRFKEIIEREDPEKREIGMQALKKVLLDKFVTKFEEIPESYWKLNERIMRERGQQGDWNNYSPEEKMKAKRNQSEGELADQKASLEQWIDYLASGDSAYMPDYIKYWVFRSVTDLQEYDKDKQEFPKRSKGTVKMFPDINQEALGYVIDAVVKKHQGKDFEFERFEADLSNEQKEEFKKRLNQESFAKLYGWANEQIHPIAKHLLLITEGRWIKYEQDDENSENYKLLNQSIRGRGTGWCTAGENTAKSQLERGDFYTYYTRDDDQKPTIPRIAIRMEGGKIGEVRGIAYKQNLDPYMGEVLEKKLNEFPDKEQYLKKDRDMKMLTELENKTKKGEALTKDDLVFLYEINDSIEGFGYQKDPRIAEVRNSRNVEEDMSIVFDCNQDQIAHNPKEIKENTKAYIGKLFSGIFQKNIEHIFTSFPEGKIIKYEVEIGGQNEEQVRKELADNNIKINDYADDLLEKTEFSKKLEQLDLVQLTIKDLGFEERATTDQIYTRAEELGLELCPAEVGPKLRLSYQGNDWMLIGMKQIVDRSGDPIVFRLGRDGASLWLRAGDARPSNVWGEGNKFVFLSRPSTKV